MNRQLKLILADGLILFVISSVIAICAHLSITALKKKGAKDDPIVTALLQGDLAETTKLAEKGDGSTNQTDDLGRTALMRAAYVNLSTPEPPSPKMRELLGAFAKCGIDFESTAKDGQVDRKALKELASRLSEFGVEVGNPLTEADDLRCNLATILLDHGAKVDSKDHDGWTALMWAAWSGLPKTAALLLDRGAAVGEADRRGNTALMLAARRGNVEIVKLLLDHHADASPANQDGRTARDMAQLGQREGTSEKVVYQKILGVLGGN